MQSKMSPRCQGHGQRHLGMELPSRDIHTAVWFQFQRLNIASGWSLLWLRNKGRLRSREGLFYIFLCQVDLMTKLVSSIFYDANVFSGDAIPFTNGCDSILVPLTGRRYLTEEKPADGGCQDSRRVPQFPGDSHEETGMPAGDRNVPG